MAAGIQFGINLYIRELLELFGSSVQRETDGTAVKSIITYRLSNDSTKMWVDLLSNRPSECAHIVHIVLSDSEGYHKCLPTLNVCNRHLQPHNVPYILAIYTLFWSVCMNTYIYLADYKS